MKRIILGILLTGLGLFFIFLTVKALIQYKNSENILPTATYVGDRALLPEQMTRLSETAADGAKKLFAKIKSRLQAMKTA